MNKRLYGLEDKRVISSNFDLRICFYDEAVLFSLLGKQTGLEISLAQTSSSFCIVSHVQAIQSNLCSGPAQKVLERLKFVKKTMSNHYVSYNHMQNVSKLYHKSIE